MQWQKVNWATEQADGCGFNFVSSLCVSPLLKSSCRYLLAGIRDGSGMKTNNIHLFDVQCEQPSQRISKSTAIAISNSLVAGDVLAAKFSPLFEKDRSIVAIYASDVEGSEGTWLSVVKLDIEDEIANCQFVCADREFRDSGGAIGTSPKTNEIIKADFELPFDFSADNLERSCIYAFTDAVGADAKTHPDIGLYRITDGEIIEIFRKWLPKDDQDRGTHICSISYFGT